MLIRSESVLAALTTKAQTHAHDRSRHLLCPSCRVRTKLHALGDGRRKCAKCGRKFNPAKKSDAVKLQQYAELLLCFCLNMTARQASTMTGNRYRLAGEVFDRFRTLLAAQSLTPGKMDLLRAVAACDHSVHESEFCSRCRGRFQCSGRKTGDAPVFGVKIMSNDNAFIDPLTESEANVRFPMDDAGAKFSGYAGFICRGKFHRFADNARSKDGAERLWAWMRERLRAHHGIWKKNAGLYLKELEWKFNNRTLTSEEQALALAELMPDDFLHAWKPEHISLDVTRAARAV